MSAKMPAIPKIIYSLWLQGLGVAPPLVQLTVRRWESLNPDYQVRVLDLHAVTALFASRGVTLPPMPAQALSDIVRAALLLDGGVWTDASVLPTRPLDDWLPDLVSEPGFFAFDKPDLDRPVASWFIAARPAHPIMRKWWAEVLRFWARPRKMETFGGGMIPPDPTWQVAPDGGAAGDTYPYFWFHYLFGYLLATDSGFAADWTRCRKVSAEPPHRLQWLLAGQPASGETIALAARDAPVHKLNWRQDYRLDVLTAL